MTANYASMQYRMYCVHKYLCSRLFSLEGQIATTNFSDDAQATAIKQKLTEFESLLAAHSGFEEKLIHPLLRERGSKVHVSMETEHQEHDAMIAKMHRTLTEILSQSNESERLLLSHQFYLSYRLFISHILTHLHHEETFIVEELKKLYTPEELAAINRKGYQNMPYEIILNMVSIQFPYMDHHDKTYILASLKAADPDKYLRLVAEKNLQEV